MKYLLDSNVLMEASNQYYQHSFCPAFWDWIDRGHAAGKLYSIDRCFDEIAEGKHGALSPWAKTRPTLFLKSTDVDTFKVLQQIGVWASKNYPPAGYAKFFDGADFVLVGFALAHGFTLVTQETPGSPTKVKIPDACKHFGLKCIYTRELLEAELPLFVLAP